MVHYDPLQATWQLRCPQRATPVAVGLGDFRQLERLAGPQRPPAYRVWWRCAQCADRHLALLTEGDLDLEPVTAPLPPFWSLQTGRRDWEPGAGELWARSVRRGHWPLTLRCSRTRQPVGGWPSLLRALEPDREPAPSRLLVHYRCPACGDRDCWTMSAGQLSLRARG